MSRAFISCLALFLGLSHGFSADLPPPKVVRPYGARVTFHNPEAPEKPPPEDSQQDKKPSGLPTEFGQPLELQLPSAPPPPSTPKDPDREAPSRGKSGKEDKGSGWGWLADEVNKQPSSSENSLLKEDPEEPDEWDAPEKEMGLTKTNAWSREDFKPREEPGTDGASNILFMSSPVAVLQDNPGWRPLETETLSMSVSEREPRRPGEASDFGADFGQDAIASDSPFSPVDPWTSTRNDPKAEGNLPDHPEGKEEVRRSAFFRENESVQTDYGSLPGLSRREASSRANPFAEPAASPVGSYGGMTPASSFGSMDSVVNQPSISTPSTLAPTLTLPSQMSPERPSLNEMGTEGQSRPKALPW